MPRLGVTVAVVLVVVSVACLIYFIDHSAKSLQIAVILDRVALRTVQDVKRLFAEDLGHAEESSAEDQQLSSEEDIIRTVAIAPTMQNVLVLGLIVLIRSFLSMALELEIEGRWPWQAREAKKQTDGLH